MSSSHFEEPSLSLLEEEGVTCDEGGFTDFLSSGDNSICAILGKA
jgi:hypothetical protein